MNITTYNYNNQNLNNELERKGWNISNIIDDKTNILLYNSDTNKLSEIVHNANSENNMFIVNCKDKSIDKIVNYIEKRSYDKLL